MGGLNISCGVPRRSRGSRESTSKKHLRKTSSCFSAVSMHLRLHTSRKEREKSQVKRKEGRQESGDGGMGREERFLGGKGVG